MVLAELVFEHQRGIFDIELLVYFWGWGVASVKDDESVSFGWGFISVLPPVDVLSDALFGIIELLLLFC